MLPNSKKTLHFGVGFLLAPPPAFEPGEVLQFQQILTGGSSAGATRVVFDSTSRKNGITVLARKDPRFEVRIGKPAPQVAQLVMVAPPPQRVAEDFKDEAASVVAAYRQVWGDPRQILQRDSTVRHSYAVRERHAFEYLWEKRLNQPAEGLGALGRPVLGGGLRVVMPSRTQVPDDPIIEVKIESLLADPRLLWVEAQFVWGQPIDGPRLDPGALVDQVEEYMDKEVRNLIMGEGT